MSSFQLNLLAPSIRRHRYLHPPPSKATNGCELPALMKDAGCYQLGHGIGYTKGADKRIGRRRMRKDVLKAILREPFK